MNLQPVAGCSTDSSFSRQRIVGSERSALIERLWRSVKYEDVYLKEYLTVKALRQGLHEYFRFYNDARPHEALGKCTPSECYNGLGVAA